MTERVIKRVTASKQLGEKVGKWAYGKKLIQSRLREWERKKVQGRRREIDTECAARESTRESKQPRERETQR